MSIFDSVAAVAGYPAWQILGLWGLLGILLSLDDTAWVQSWLSQPLTAGILAGVVGGDPVTGLALGLPLQLITIGNLPVGQTLTPEPVGPVVGGVAAVLVQANRLAVAPGLDPHGATALQGWVLLGVVLGSVTGHLVVQLERRIHFLWMLAGHRYLREGNPRGFERLLVRCLALTAVRGLVLTGFWFWLLGWLWIPLLAHLPACFTSQLHLLPWLAVPLGVVVLLNRYGIGVAWRLGVVGFGLAFGLTWWGGG